MKQKRNILLLNLLLVGLLIPSLTSCRLGIDRRPGIEDNPDTNLPNDEDNKNPDSDPDFNLGDTFIFNNIHTTYNSITLDYELGNNTHIKEIILKNVDSSETIQRFDFDVKEITNVSRKFTYEIEFKYIINNTNELKMFVTPSFMLESPIFSAEFTNIKTYQNSIDYDITLKNEKYFILKDIDVQLLENDSIISDFNVLHGSIINLKSDTEYTLFGKILTEDIETNIVLPYELRKVVRTQKSVSEQPRKKFVINNLTELKAPWVSSETERVINLSTSGNFDVNEYINDGLLKIKTDNPLLEVSGNKLIRKTNEDLGIVKVSIQLDECIKEVIIPVLKNDEGLIKTDLILDRSLLTKDFGIDESRAIKFQLSDLSYLTFKTYLDNNFKFIDNNTIKSINAGTTLIVFYNGDYYDYIYLEAFNKDCEKLSYEAAVKNYFLDEKNKYFKIPAKVVSIFNVNNVYVLCDGKDYFLAHIRDAYCAPIGTNVIVSGYFSKNTTLRTLNLNDLTFITDDQKIFYDLPKPIKTTTEDLIDLYNRGMKFDFDNPVYEDFPKTLYIEDEIITNSHNTNYCFADYFRFNIKGYKNDLYKLSYGIYNVKGFTNGISSESYDRSFLFIDDYTFVKEGTINVDVKYNLPNVVKTNEIINLLKYTESIPSNSTREIYTNSETEIVGLKRLNVSHIKFIYPGHYEVPLKANSETSVEYIWKVNVID